MHLAVRPVCRRSFLGGFSCLPFLAGVGGLAAAAAAAAAGTGPASQSMTEVIGEIVSKSSADRLTEDVRARVIACLVDNVATLTFTAHAARQDPYLARISERKGRREAVIVGSGKRAPVEDAAGALAFLIHYAETDDSDFRAELRASPIVIGPALAAGQMFGATGDDLIAAIASGYSVMGALAAPFGALQPAGLMSSGFWGAAASAAVTARLMRLNASQTAHALSLALSAAGGTFQYFYDQTEEKRLILGRAARAGCEAALLAAAGEHGARHILEGEAGIYNLLRRITDRQPDLSGVVESIRQLDGPLYIYPKFYSASSSITPSLEALQPLLASGLRPDAIREIAFRGDPAIWTPISSKLEAFEAPSTLIGAKINYAYMIAFFLTHGAADAATMSKADFADARVIDLARRVRFDPRDGLDVHIVLTLQDGAVLEAEVPNQMPGQPAPLAAGLREEKFTALTRPVIGARRSEALRVLAGRAGRSEPARDWISRLDRIMRP